ncbi:MAG: D-2-hydroxyacid dehydrogenase [Hyphomicrobiales bacterium]|nr:D-2-hydroxyacid dehydrogenase [Hyphomicrobiales bacterium]
MAHPAYRLGDALDAARPGFSWQMARDVETMLAMAGEADAMIVSGLWRDELLTSAPHLRFVQSISAGVNHFPVEAMRARGMRLASAQGVNSGAVAEHALALMLALSRHLHLARDRQQEKIWRPMIGNPAIRERELAGLTLLIVGLGGIGRKLAGFAKALGMSVLATKRDVSDVNAAVDQVVPAGDLLSVLPQADIVVLTCPLTPETTGIINGEAFIAMKEGAVLINVARGKVVVEEAMITALRTGKLSAAGLDCVDVEPLPATSPLWAFDNVLITPHSAGETRSYEAGVIDLFLDNFDRLMRGETRLRNEIV